MPTLRTPIYNGWYYVGSGKLSKGELMPMILAINPEFRKNLNFLIKNS